MSYDSNPALRGKQISDIAFPFFFFDNIFTYTSSSSRLSINQKVQYKLYFLLIELVQCYKSSITAYNCSEFYYCSTLYSKVNIIDTFE